MLLQAILGLQQDAPRGKLYVDPALPDWLPDMTLTDLRLGRRRFDIHFWRDGKDTVFKVLTGKPDAVERRSIALSGSAPASAGPQTDGTVYLVLDDFGAFGRAWRETDESAADRQTVIAGLLSGQYERPLKIVAFNARHGARRDAR
jgi:hypothetical protein